MITHYIVPAASGKTTFAVKESKLKPNTVLVMSTRMIAYQYDAKVWDDVPLRGGKKIDRLIFDEYLEYRETLSRHKKMTLAEELRILSARGTEIILISTPVKRYTSALWFIDKHELSQAFRAFTKNSNEVAELDRMQNAFVLTSVAKIRQHPKWLSVLPPYVKQEMLDNLGQERYEMLVEAKFLT